MFAATIWFRTACSEAWSATYLYHAEQGVVTLLTRFLESDGGYYFTKACISEVGVGYHHPPIQWLNRLMAGLWMHAKGVTLRLSPARRSAWLLCPASPAPGALSPWLSSGSGQQCMRIRPRSYGRHRLRDASSLSLMRVDAVRAMRTRAMAAIPVRADLL